MPTIHTHLTRQPTRAAVSIRSGVAAIYAMAGPLFWKPIIWTPRVGARAAFGARQCAGLSISSIILWDELKRT